MYDLFIAVYELPLSVRTQGRVHRARPGPSVMRRLAPAPQGTPSPATRGAAGGEFFRAAQYNMLYKNCTEVRPAPGRRKSKPQIGPEKVWGMAVGRGAVAENK